MRRSWLSNAVQSVSWLLLLLCFFPLILIPPFHKLLCNVAIRLIPSIKYDIHITYTTKKLSFSFKDYDSSKNGQYSPLCCLPHISPLSYFSVWRPVPQLQIARLFRQQTHGLSSELILSHLLLFYITYHSYLKMYFFWLP